jgi:hypothetical protein
VLNDPPHIVFTTTPTVLISVDGEPAWQDVSGTRYQQAINTRALLLRDPEGVWYLKAAGHWYARSGDGAWHVRTASHDLVNAADATNRAMPYAPLLPGSRKAVSPAPAILLATQPTELVVSHGPFELAAVAGTRLQTVTNTEHAVFVDPGTSKIYVLISGRWFSAVSGGPWQYVPGGNLPGDFAKISPLDPKANVLVSIPGTPQAREAEIATTIPQTATVSRTKATATVRYDGAPSFAPIAGTPLSYAANTASPVVRADDAHYYCVTNWVWFSATAPTRPWQVATAIPDAIYAIPVSSPLYYVTYVRIYSVTADAVVVGYTPGYQGVYVNLDGTVVFGTGYAYPPYIGSVWYGYPATYGYGAGFALGEEQGFAFGFAAGESWGAAWPYWEPYWWWGYGYYRGYGYYVNVNQANFYGRWGQGTVTYAEGWNAWTGTEWRAAAAQGYNPATGAHYRGGKGAAFNPYSGSYAAGRRGAVANPTTGQVTAAPGGAVGNAYTGEYAAGRQIAGYNPETGYAGAAEAKVTGNAQTGERSVSSQGVLVNTGTGNAIA